MIIDVTGNVGYRGSIEVEGDRLRALVGDTSPGKSLKMRTYVGK